MKTLTLNILLIVLTSFAATASPITDSVENYVEKHLNLPPDTSYQLKITAAPSPQKKHQEYTIVPSTPNLLRAKTFTVLGKSNNKVEKRYTVQASIDAMGKIAVASRDLYRGDTLTDSDFSYEDRPLRNLNDFVFTNTPLEGVVSRTIRMGTPIKTTHITPPTLVSRGQPVTVLVSFKTIELSTKATALQDGGSGDYIKLKNLNSKRTFRGQVISDGVVKVGL